MGSEQTRLDLEQLLTMETKLRLLELENVPIPEQPPPTPDLLSSSSSQQLGIHLKRQPGQCLLAACLILSKNRRGDQAPDALPHRWRNFLLLPNPLSGLSPPPSFSLLPCCFSPLMCNIFAFFF